MDKKAKVALCLFKYFPFGGLQRDFLKIAETCLDRGHEVQVYAAAWQGESPAGLQVSILPATGFTNHGRAESFAAHLRECLDSRPVDAVVGFNKMPGLDLYFASDPCFASKAALKHPWYRLTPRCRTYLRLERAVFSKASKTEILLLSHLEKSRFVKHYGTPENRFHLLPPGIPRDRVAPGDATRIREQFRSELGLSPDQKVLLMVGSGFRTKGVDRAIKGLSALSRELREKAILLIVGEDKPGPFRRLATRRGVANRVRFMGGREDVHRFLMAADLLLHPAYRENTGAVLIEAMAAGLPVLATDVCGYASHVISAGAGELVPSPYVQKAFNALLATMLVSDKRAQWREKGIQYVAETDVFSLHKRAVDIVEQVVRR